MFIIGRNYVYLDIVENMNSYFIYGNSCMYCRLSIKIFFLYFAFESSIVSEYNLSSFGWFIRTISSSLALPLFISLPFFSLLLKSKYIYFIKHIYYRKGKQWQFPSATHNKTTLTPTLFRRVNTSPSSHK